MRAYPLAVIVIAQLFGTSLWFSANSAGDDLMRSWALQTADIGRLTIAVQLGFILGTLGFALSGLADRFAASRIFAVCAALGAAASRGRAEAQSAAQGIFRGVYAAKNGSCIVKLSATCFRAATANGDRRNRTEHRAARR